MPCRANRMDGLLWNVTPLSRGPSLPSSRSIIHYPDSTLLEPQSRFGYKPVKFYVVRPPKGTAILRGLNTFCCRVCYPTLSFMHVNVGYSRPSPLSRSPNSLLFYVCLSVCLPVCLSVCFFVSVGLPACLPACVSVCLSCLSRLSACVYVCPCVCLYISSPSPPPLSPSPPPFLSCSPLPYSQFLSPSLRYSKNIALCTMSLASRSRA